MKEKCEYFNNGRTTIDRVIQLVENAIIDLKKESGTIRPISLMLLDFQMPDKNGLEVVESVRKFYEGTIIELEITMPNLKL